jgi:hypothetical protein
VLSHGGVGQEYDMEGPAPACHGEAAGLPKGETLRKWAMRAVEARLERHLELPYWDMLIRPASLA